MFSTFMRQPSRINANDHEMIPPARPEPGKGDPESSVERRQLRSGVFLDIHSKLLLKSQVDDRLLSMTSEEGEDAMEGQRYESDQGAHGERDRAGFLGQELV